ncbi:TTLL5 polyglutamylase, partial [Turnix velox]|nr:TTLL5 polyglutamylase [Turnix velox]
ELYGFDVLIDDNLKPWLLEVNLSPSLACDAPLDLKIKASMLSDMFTLVGFVCQDPSQRSNRVVYHSSESARRNPYQKLQRTRPLSASDAEIKNSVPSGREKATGRQGSSLLGLSIEEIKVLRRVREENERRGGFIRIFPTPFTWDLYGSFLEHKTSMNYMLATHLFQDRTGLNEKLDVRLEAGDSHALFYERKLISLELRKRRRCHSKARAARARLSGASDAAKQSLKSDTDGEEEEEVDAGEDEEELGRTTDSLKNKPKLSELVNNPCKERLPKKHDKKTGDRGELLLQKTKSESQFNLLQILQKQGNLSKVQARRAFSAYLQHVQLRLMKEAGDQIQNPAWAAKEDEQMELVVHFLKRATSNLQQSLRMLSPTRHLALSDRRRILAHQLGQFIICYNKAKQMAQKRLKKKQEEEEEEGVNPEGFQNFITKASERELEEVLTFYTQKSKSASVFLGTNSRSSKPSNTSNQSEKQPHVERPEVVKKKIEQPRSSVEDLPPEGAFKVYKPKEVKSTLKLPQCDPPLAAPSVSGAMFQRNMNSWTTSQPAASAASHVPGHHSLLAPPGGPRLLQTPSPLPSSQSTVPDTSSVPRNPVFIQPSSLAELHRYHSGSYTIGQFSSFPRAAHIYSQRLTRPSSAKAGECCGIHKSVERLMYRSTEDNSSQGKCYSPSLVAAELQQLEKQAASHCPPPSHITLLTQQLTNLNLASGAVSKGNTSASPSYWSTLDKRGSLWLHPDTHVADKGPVSSAVRVPESRRFAWEAEVDSSVYSKVAQNPLTHPNCQFRFAVQQLKQQKFQSQQLLDQSQARHQTLFANYSQSSTSPASTPAGSGARKTSNATSSIQKAANWRKVVPTQSTPSLLLPKPPANHRQAAVRKTAARRISK